MTTLDDLIQQTYEQVRVEEKTKAQAQAQDNQQALEKAAADFRAALLAELGTDIMTGLGIECMAHRGHLSKEISVVGSFVDRECDWRIRVNGYQRSGEVQSWW